MTAYDKADYAQCCPHCGTFDTGGKLCEDCAAQEEPEVWWVIEIVPGPALRVTFPESSMRMPADQARRLAQALNMAADATPT